MCYQCLLDAGAETVPYPDDDLGLAADMKKLYEWHVAGGPLHVMLDDMNLEDNWFEEDAWDLAKYHGDDDECPDATECEALCDSIRQRLYVFPEAVRARVVWDTLWAI